ncbi:MAG: PAS domain S-box protein, partial [Bacteroidia bacterium]
MKEYKTTALSSAAWETHTEIQLKQITTLYQTLLDNVPGYVVCRNYDGQFLFVNNEFAALFNKKPEEVVGLTDAAYGATQEEINFYLQADRKVIDSGKPLFIDSEVVLRKDGSRGLFQVSKVPLYLPEQDEKAVLIVALDITERKEIEAQRQLDLEIERAVNLFSKDIFEQNDIDNLLWKVAHDCISKLNFDDVIIYFLDKSEQFLVQKAAYGDKNPIGQEIANPIIIPLGKGIVGSVAHTGIAEIVEDTTLDERYIIDDKCRMSEITVPIMLNGKVIGIIDSEHEQKGFYTEKHLRILTIVSNLVANCIDRILTDKQAKEEEAKFRFIAENTSDGILVIENQTLTYISPACEKIWGYQAEELHEKPKQEIFELLHAEDMNHFLQALAEATRQQKSVFTYEGKVKHKLGHYIWREDNINLLYDNQGQAHSLVIVMRDVTERVEKKEQLQSLLDITSKQNERLMNFAHIVSHNIRSHASNLSMIVSFMEAERPNNSASEMDYFSLLKQSTDKLAETIKNLNEIITIQTHVNSLRTPLCIYDEVQKTLNSLNNIILTNEATIINEVPKDYEVQGAAAYMESIFLNLLSNALKYRAKDRKPIVTFSAKKVGNCLTISVQDNGLGIDLQRHGHKVFGMYKTFHANADARGIGLFITKNQVESMGGKIEVESEVGIGTCFKIYFCTDTES